MLSLGLCALVALAAAVKYDTSSSTSSSSNDCPDCVEQPETGEMLVYGACCWGDKSLGNTYTKLRCPSGAVWAGPNTNNEDCAKLNECCFPHEAGKCSLERCFDCINKNGYLISDCNDCHAVTTKPHTLPPATSRPKPTLPTLTTTAHKNGKGCCCVPGSTPRIATAEECHECDGVYRGDGTTCHEAGICEARCCQLGSSASRECQTCPAIIDPLEHRFVTFDDTCEPETCGVTCCINAQAIEAPSTEVCESAGGVSFPSVPLSQADCGVGCCVGLVYQIVANDQECEDLQGRSLGSGEAGAFSPGVCGGACCLPNGCQLASVEECAEKGGVFQGNDVPCPLAIAKRKRGEYQHHHEDDDELSSSSESSSSSSSSSGSSSGSSSSSSSISSSSFSDTKTSSEEPPLEDLDICANDGCCCLPNGGGSVRVASSVACYHLKGVFLGEGSVCGVDSCKGGACCASDFGGKQVKNRAECELLGGKYAGDGSNVENAGVCDESGACLCGQDCYEVPSAGKCSEIHGESFRGVGSKCTDENLQPPENEDDEGACCMPKSFHSDYPICVLMPTRQRCEFAGGKWIKAGSKCEDETCRDMRGSCCTSTTCLDAKTLKECHECDGHWGGIGSLCSDEYSCQPNKRGACCRDAHECSMGTATLCRRQGGRFQGFESKCSDQAGQICKRCVPCEQFHAPSCSEAQPCENPLATCNRQYGKCVVMPTPIPSFYDNHVLALSSEESEEQSSSSSERSSSSSSVSSARSSTTSDVYEDAGPLLCSSDNSTLGLPCIAPPLLGKCRIGVCMPPVEGSTLNPATCGSVCRAIREYPCGCECGGDWQRQCASISGRVIHDKDGDSAFDVDVDGGVLHALVELLISDGFGEYTFVAEQQVETTGGHYAFSSLVPGKYKVRVTLPGCFAHSDEINHRIVTVNCLESAHAAQRLAETYNAFTAQHSVQIEHRVSGQQLAPNIDFYAIHNCEQADVQHQAPGGDLGKAPDVQAAALEEDASSDSGGVSAIVWVTIGVLAFLLLGGILLCVLWGSNTNGSVKRKSRSN
jgi:hypothetical protein